MTGPNDRILPPGGLGPKQQPIYIGVDLSSQPDMTAATVVLSPEALAALPEVQALIRQAVEAEREACARLVDCGCDRGKKAAVLSASNGADRARACEEYACGADDAAAIRKRGEG